jgi:putative ABC transport system permease protein
VLGDLRYACRSLGDSRGFSFAAILTLALGIGANTAIFTVIYGVLLKPLPFGNPDRIVRLTEGRPGFRLNVSYPNFVDWRARNHVFDAMAIFNTLGTVVLAHEGGPSEVFPSGTCDAQFFGVLGVQAAQGRVFIEAEQQPSTPVVAVITDSLWRRRFGRDPSLLSRAIRMGDDEVTIIGVLPPGVEPMNIDVWFPMRQLSPMQLDRANHPGFAVIARLREHTTLDAAQREMTRIAESLAREYPSSNDRMGVFVTPLLESVAGRARPMLAALGCAVGVLLLMACANVANLLLTRGLGRERETSIRSALGASRGRLIRLFLVEGLILGTAGAVAGLLLAGWGVRVLRAVPGIALPRTADIAINPQALGFAGLLALTTAALFAFAPAWHLSRVDLMHTLRIAGSTDGSRRATRLRSTLVAIEVGLLVVLLACATLMQRTLTYLAGVDPGFRPDGLMAVRLVQPGQQYDGDTAARFAARLDDSIRATGYATAAVAWPFDYTGFSWAPNIDLPATPFPDGQQPVAQAATVTPDYFETMGIPLLRGRNFGPLDRRGAPVVAIVSQSFARRFFPDADPIGRRVSGVRVPEMQNMPIVGVVGDTRRGGILEGFTPEIYVSYAQFPQSGAAVIVRASSGDPLRLANEVTARIAAIDPGIAIDGVRRLSDQLASTYGDRRALTWLLGLFAALALGLTALGIGSVVSFTVASRRSEIGIRTALGAHPQSLMRLFVLRSLGPVLFGAVTGALALVPVTRLMRRYVFGVSPTDPVSLAIAALILMAVACGSAYVPARRAAQGDPLVALRTP